MPPKDIKKRLSVDMTPGAAAPNDGFADSDAGSNDLDTPEQTGASPSGGRRRSSLSKQQPTFKDRRLEYGGDTAVDVVGEEARIRSMVGTVCRRGKKPDAPCQDDFFIIVDPCFVLIGVLDGHGPVGHLLANLAQKVIRETCLNDLAMMMNNPGQVFASAYQQAHTACEKMAGSHTSGSTVTVSLLRKDDVSTAWLGDSKAILVKKVGKSFECAPLTAEHRPSLPAEKARIEAAGGKVEIYSNKDGADSRVFDKNMEGPGLAMSRALGDLWGHECGVIHEPDVQKASLTGWECFACGSDGVWDFVSNEEVAKRTQKEIKNVLRGATDMATLARPSALRKMFKR
jgi:serine/threonine protein phosphatase PrpC